jgi:anthranilate phosphoribosyltransferase
VLEGQDGPALRVVLANAAAALVSAERVTDLKAGVDLARKAIASGQALEVLKRLRE